MTGRDPLPILLVVLDGMADRPYPRLAGRTPLEAANTPVMDRLVGEGQAGFYYPLGPGRVPSTELVHWRLFGYDGYPFPGRACLEAMGHGVSCAAGDTFSFLALRRVVREPGGAFRVTGGYGEDFGDASAGYSELAGWVDEQTGYCFGVFPLPGGEAILRIQGACSGEVTDSDPFFFTDLPVLRPRPSSAATRPLAAAETAGALDRFLARAAGVFNERGVERLVVSKWTGTLGALPSFTELTGLEGSIVASSRLMRGFARALDLRYAGSVEPGAGSENDLAGSLAAGDAASKLERALEALKSGEVAFAHVHTKAADEVSHRGDPGEKVATIEALDRGLSALLEIPSDRLVLCVTSDHCTPVGGLTVHWGDSVPILVRGPHVRVDGVSTFAERSAVGGTLGRIVAADLLPFLLCQADRAHFLGAQPLPTTPLGVPLTGEPWSYRGPFEDDASSDELRG